MSLEKFKKIARNVNVPIMETMTISPVDFASAKQKQHAFWNKHVVIDRKNLVPGVTDQEVMFNGAGVKTHQALRHPDQTDGQSPEYQEEGVEYRIDESYTAFRDDSGMHSVSFQGSHIGRAIKDNDKWHSLKGNYACCKRHKGGHPDLGVAIDRLVKHHKETLHMKDAMANEEIDPETKKKVKKTNKVSAKKDLHKEEVLDEIVQGHKYNSNNERIPPKHYNIVNHRSNSVVGKAKTLNGARRSVENHDNKYGGYAHTAYAVYEAEEVSVKKGGKFKKKFVKHDDNYQDDYTPDLKFQEDIEIEEAEKYSEYGKNDDKWLDNHNNPKVVKVKTLGRKGKEETRKIRDRTAHKDTSNPNGKFAKEEVILEADLDLARLRVRRAKLRKKLKVNPNDSALLAALNAINQQIKSLENSASVKAVWARSAEKFKTSDNDDHKE